ncbi:MAG TPA: hypothetical protein PLX02_06900 [Syntrophorhabdaceae bacterium]|nr:hypothetical protein [Syntrophorhabdaceae bacterium]
MLILIVLSLFSCSSIPFIKNKTGSDAGNTKKINETSKTKKTDIGGQPTESSPKPGDIKVVDGVEHIYVSNRKYMLTPYEPQYVWERKDQYSPRFGENLLTDRSSEKESKMLDDRISKLEEELKKKAAATPQAAYPSQITSLPSPVTGNMPVPVFSPTYPSPKMKRRVIVLPMADETRYKELHLGELATKMLKSKLENTNAVVCVDPGVLNLKGETTDSGNMTVLNEIYGVQAVIKGTLSDTAAGPSSVIFNANLFVYETETGTVIRQLSGKGIASFPGESGGLRLGETKIGSMDASIGLIADDLLKNLLAIEWHTRIASIENGKIYINAGRLSGLENGATLEVYSPGTKIIDSKTKTPLGKTKGVYKGELKVSDLFGVDASCAIPTQGGNFSTSDMIYLKKP